MKTQAKGAQIQDDSLLGQQVREETLDASKMPFSSSGFSASNVKAAIIEAKTSPALVTSIHQSSTVFTTTSRYPTFARITGCQITPPAGIYLVQYNASVDYDTTPKMHKWAFYKGASKITSSERTQETSHADTSMVDSLLEIIEVNGTDVISVRVACDNTGTLTVNSRTLVAIRIGP